MIKLFEPFQQKIGLCRNTGFLQNLWDKYVPRTSENYGRISLIYLKGGSGDEPKQKQQVELLISLLLKNISVQTNLSQNPVLFNQTAISRSVKQMRKIYLQQLMRIDFGLYQSLNQYTVHLEQAEREEIRYREWTKENRLITRMQREYQVLHALSGRLKELAEWSAGQERRFVKNLFRSYGKKEYKILSEAFLWAEKRQVEELIRHCSEGQYRNILTRMEKEPELYPLSDDMIHVSPKILPQEMEQADQKADIPKTEDGMGAGDAWKAVPKDSLASLIRSYGQKKFRRFCHQVLSAEIQTDKTYQRLLQAGLFWKKDKKEIYQQLELMGAEEIHRFWEEIPLISAKVCRMQEELSQERHTLRRKELQEEGRTIRRKELQEEGRTIRRKELQEEEQTIRRKELQEEGRIIRRKELQEEGRTIRQEERYRVCRKFSESLEKVRKKYREEIREYVQDTVFRIENRDEYEIILNAVDIPAISETDSVPVYAPPDEVRLFHRDMDAAKAGKMKEQIFADYIRNIQRSLTEQLEVREKRIIQRERQILYQYKDIYREILSDEEFGKIYHPQLPGADVQIDQPLNPYSVRLGQAEREEIRYREWAKENRLITQMHREYQVLHGLSERLKDLDEVWAAGQERRYGKILFRPFDKKEYKILSEAFLWAEKQQVEKFILQCSEGQYQNILTQMEPQLYNLLEEVRMDHVVQTADVSETEEVLAIRDAQKPIPRERFVSLIRTFGQKKFRRFCHQILSVEMKADETYQGLLQAGLFLEKDKKEIYQQFERMKGEEIHRFWEEIPLITAKVCRMQEELHEEGQSIRQENRYRVCRKFSESLEKVRKKYRKEIRRYVQDTVLHVENQDEYEIIQNAADIPAMLETDSVPVYTSLDEIRLSHGDMDAEKAGGAEEYIFTHHIQDIRRSLTEQLEIRGQKIVQTERQVLERYKDIYKEILSEEEFNIYMNLHSDLPGDSGYAFEKSIEIEKIFRQRHEKEELSNTFIEKLKNWGEALLSLPQEERGKTQTADAGSGFEEKFGQQIPAFGDRADLQRLTSELALYIEEIENEETNEFIRPDTEEAETVKDSEKEAILVYRDEQVYNPQIQELLQYFRQTKEEERQVFMRQLADMLMIQRQVAQEDIFMQAVEEGAFIRERKEPLRFVNQPADDVPGAAALEGQNAAWGNPFVELPGQGSIRTELVSEEFGEMQEWGRALLYHPVFKSDEKEEELTVSLQEGTDGLSIEELHTHVIRQHIEAAKQRTELQRVLMQVNHLLKDSGVQIEYHKGQLRDPSIRKMVSWLGELEGTQYQEAVSGLADAVLMLRGREPKPEHGGSIRPANQDASHGQEFMQRIRLTDSEQEHTQGIRPTEHAQESTQRIHTTKPGQELIQRLSGTRSEREAGQRMSDIYSEQGQVHRLSDIYSEQEQVHRLSEIDSVQEQVHRLSEVYSEQEKRKGMAGIYSEQEQAHNLSETDFGEIYGSLLHDIYPELAHRIRQYEVQREKIRAAEARQMQILYTDRMELSLQSENGGMPEADRARLVSAYPGYRGRQEITYVFSEESLSGGKPKNRADAQKETQRVKSLLQQMEARLKEVEKQLQKKADVRQAGEIEDIRSIAEKVKKQLHEELHMERLRRGMV